MNDTGSIYVDHAATTPLHPQVIEDMSSVLRQVYGNPSSMHAFGREARGVIQRARQHICQHLGIEHGQELVMTSGGTEADNLAIMGVALAHQHLGRHIVTSSVEHHAVLHTCQKLEKLGFEVTYVPVDHYGQVRPEDVHAVLRDDTILVSIMYVNNETGTVQPIEQIGKLVQERGIIFHTDAVQALGVLPIHCAELPADLISFSAHKLNGPKGAGALYVAQGTALEPLFSGGNQERQRRAGTENTAAIVGFASAVELACGAQAVAEKQKMMTLLRTKLLDVLDAGQVDYTVNGYGTEASMMKQVPHILNVSFTHIKAEQMLMNLDIEGVAASSGSACMAGSLQPSHVIAALDEQSGSDTDALIKGNAQNHSSLSRAETAIRFSFGYGNTLEQIEQVGSKVIHIIERMNVV